MSGDVMDIDKELIGNNDFGSDSAKVDKAEVPAVVMPGYEEYDIDVQFGFDSAITSLEDDGHETSSHFRPNSKRLNTEASNNKRFQRQGYYGRGHRSDAKNWRTEREESRFNIRKIKFGNGEEDERWTRPGARSKSNYHRNLPVPRSTKLQDSGNGTDNSRPKRQEPRENVRENDFRSTQKDQKWARLGARHESTSSQNLSKQKSTILQDRRNRTDDSRPKREEPRGNIGKSDFRSAQKDKKWTRLGARSESISNHNISDTTSASVPDSGNGTVDKISKTEEIRVHSRENNFESAHNDQKLARLGARPKSTFAQNHSVLKSTILQDNIIQRPRAGLRNHAKRLGLSCDSKQKDEDRNLANGEVAANPQINIHSNASSGRSYGRQSTDKNEDICNDSSDYVYKYRPKAKTWNDETKLQNSSSTNNWYKSSEEFQSGRKMVIGFPFLKNLISREPGYIVLELTKNTTALKECLKRASENQEFLEVFLQALSEAYESRTTPGLMIELFNILKEENFFNSVMFLLIDIMGRADIKERPVKQMLKNILQIIIGQISSNPSSLFVVSRTCTVLGQIIESLPNENGADDEIIAMYRDLAEQKVKLDNEQKTDCGSKQGPKPPDDFRQYPVSPSPSEILGTRRPFLRKNKVEGEYDDLDHYLDVQFRLLREDFVGPLREGITEYIKIKTSAKTKRNDKSIRQLNIKIYERVTVLTPVVTEHGLCFKMKLEMNHYLRRIKWSVSKRLMYGSLVCLTDNGFNTFYLATVVGRDEDDISKGFFILHFEQEDVITHDILQRIFQMVETSAYFEAYRHVLSSMQLLRQGDLPFEKYIVYCDSEVGAPAYLRHDTTYDLRPLVDQHVELQSERRLTTTGARIRALPNDQFTSLSKGAQSVNILDKTSWPSKELLHLDESQYDAVQTALTSEFAVIQGPPGTGKTYIGLQIVKALLHNKSAWLGSEYRIRPMLVVCYTNHALDQFLEGILKYFKGDVLRVGGRSDSLTLKNCSLKHYRYNRQSENVQLAKLRMSRQQARDDLDKLSDELKEMAKSIEIYQSEIIGENYLREQIGERLFQSLIQHYTDEIRNRDTFSYIMKWLGIERIEEIARQQAEQQASEGVDEQFVALQAEMKQEHEYLMIDSAEDLEHSKKKDATLLRNLRHKTGIVFYVHDEMKTENDKNEENEMQNLSRILKTTLERNISDFDIMFHEEADNVRNVWHLDQNNRWRLYRMWIQNLCSTQYDRIEERRTQFELASERYREAMMQEDREIMKQAAVIGMTTSCAARYQSVLRDIGPRIIIVEEAAEVLEAHIVTTLSKGCEHLILIGDHKQLRPNPTVYRLATKYNLDVSLFERMIKNKMAFNCLKLQHRMRPQISSLVKHIYPDLLDHKSIETHPDIKGISKNIFLVSHKNEENQDEDIKSYSNMFEAEYTAQLCQYLLLQGYERNEITILTTYTGQLMCIRRFMPREQFQGVKVTVVDNYQGEENNIIILSLVRSNKNEKIGFLKTENRICVALSRAKYGFYILGNFNHLATYSTLWKKITEEMKEKECLGTGLKLCCQNHPQDKSIDAVAPDDFKNAPEGGCKKYCDIRLKCGHVCKRFCHVLDMIHETNKCLEPCPKILCDNGHKCPYKCYVKCKPCQVPMQKTIPKCNHVQTIPCDVSPEKISCRAPCEMKLQCGHQCDRACGDTHRISCTAEIEFKFPCGHESTIRCGEKEVAKCQHPCGAVLMCEHLCSGTCSSCFFGKIHQPCQHECKRILVCGHVCGDYCSNCPPCKAPCENRCVHSQCDKYCGEPCVPCQERCSWKCQHYKCSKPCSEPCDRPRCNKWCKKLLKCNHPCIGFCGEPCPHLCRICHVERVSEIIFGDEDNPKARFVLLEDCLHVIESRALDKYMEMRNESGAIQLKGCPRCKTPIRKCLRYGNLINRTLEDVERVKQHMIGNTSIIERVSRYIRDNPIVEERSYVTRIRPGLSMIDRRAALIERSFSKSHDNEYQKFLESSLKTMRLNKLCTETQLLSLENQHRIVKTFLDLKCKIDDNVRKMYGKTVKNGTSKAPRILNRLTTKMDVLTEQEIEDFTREIQKWNMYVKYLEMMGPIRSAGKEKEATDYCQKIKALLQEKGKFTEERETECNGLMKNLTDLMKIDGLGITEAERLDIVKAVGLSKGHWFKCPKGHIYAIGECGGANQKSKCPECNLDIGGVQHRLMDGNKLAPEMDGAPFAAYSEEANNMGNFDLNNLH